MNYENYKSPSKEIWQGRIDSLENYDAFRWHQYIEIVDMNCEEELKQMLFSASKDEIKFALLGYCCDVGVKRNLGRVGSAKGPEAIRKALANRPCSFEQNIKIYDIGDVICIDENLENAQATLSEIITFLLKNNVLPFVMGGGHDVAYGTGSGVINGIKTSKLQPVLGVINFDAHFDCRPYENGATSGTMFKQLYDDCEHMNVDYRYMCVGAQKSGNTKSLFNTVEMMGGDYILSRDLKDQMLSTILAKIAKFIEPCDNIYVTICTDVFSSAFAPAVSAPQPLGMMPDIFLEIFKSILDSGKVIAMDIAEILPELDSDNITSTLGSLIIYTAVNNEGERREGEKSLQ